MRQCEECTKPAYHGLNGKWYCREHYPTGQKFCSNCYRKLPNDSVSNDCLSCREEKAKWMIR